jgi:hypothetical protein
VEYEITQTGTAFTWFAPKLDQHAQGTVAGNRLTASWQGSPGSGSGKATIEEIDSSSSRADRIRWDNGVIFTREPRAQFELPGVSAPHHQQKDDEEEEEIQT